MSAVPPPPPPGSPGPPPPPPAYGGPQGTGPVVGLPRGRGLATAALVCGIAGIPLFVLFILSAVALVLGLVGASQIKGGPLPHDGLGRARAGWILGAIGLAGFAAFVVGIATGAIDVDEDDAAPLRTLDVGDCLNFDVDRVDGTEISSLPRVDCDDPHTAEVFLVDTLEDDAAEFPGLDVIVPIIEERCFSEADDYVDAVDDLSSLEVFYIHPTELSWRLRNRQFVCMVVTADGGTRTGPVGGGD